MFIPQNLARVFHSQKQRQLCLLRFSVFFARWVTFVNRPLRIPTFQKNVKGLGIKKYLPTNQKVKVKYKGKKETEGKRETFTALLSRKQICNTSLSIFITEAEVTGSDVGTYSNFCPLLVVSKKCNSASTWIARYLSLHEKMKLFLPSRYSSRNCEATFLRAQREITNLAFSSSSL